MSTKNKKPSLTDLFAPLKEAATVVGNSPPVVSRFDLTVCDCWCGKLAEPKRMKHTAKCSGKVELNIENAPLCSWCWVNHQPVASQGGR